MRLTRIFTIGSLVPLLALAAVPASAGRPADAVPEVIAPADVPQMQAIWSDSDKQTPTPKGGFVSAPMPDSDAAAPIAAADNEDPHFQPAFFSRQRQFRGDGFAPGSTAQDVQERSIKPAPGLALNVPLN